MTTRTGTGAATTTTTSSTTSSTTRSPSAGGPARTARVASRSRCTSPTRRSVPPPRARTSRPTSPNTRATWATTATRWTGGTAGPQSWCGRGTGRSRRAPKPGRSGRCRNCAPASRPETGKGHVPLRSRSRRSGKISHRRRDCWIRRCTWRRAWTAAMLLEPFRAETVTPEHAGGLAAAAGQYGEEWTRDVIDGWFGSKHYFEADRHEWVERLPELCGALRAAGGPEVARLLAAGARGWMGDQLRLWTTTARTEIREPQLEMLGSPLVRLLEAADDELRDEIVAALRGYGDNVLGCLMPALRSSAALLTATRRAAGLDVVARDCGERLGAIIARPLRDEDDWSIEWTGCGCDLCHTLGTFLGSRSRRVFEWPLATDGRRHMHTRIDSAGLPVRHQTRRQGRPYTLVLTKTGELFTREKDARHKAVTDLAWLRSAWGDGSPEMPLPSGWPGLASQARESGERRKTNTPQVALACAKAGDRSTRRHDGVVR